MSTVGQVVADNQWRDVFGPQPDATAPLPAHALDLQVGDWVLLVGESCTLEARRDSARGSLYALVEKHGLNPSYPDAVLAETARWVEQPGLDDASLVDRTDLAFVTIDDASSRDLDQAVYIEPWGRDGHRIWYALADAAYYVRPGTALFKEALRRGVTYYLPGLAVPMLPRPLSEGIVSLNPGVLRRALVMRMDLDAAGRCVDTEMERARIRCRAKLSFEQVQAYLDGETGGPVGEVLGDRSLNLLREVGLVRMARAEERDVTRYRRAEVDIHLDGKAGARFVATSGLRNDVERYNEQISLLCNRQGARFLRHGNPSRVQPIYRVHPPPTEERIAALERQVEGLIEAHELSVKEWGGTRDSGISLAAYLRGANNQY